MIKQKEEKNLIVGLDIGTSTIVTIVSEIKNDGEIQILGIGQHVSRGLKKGVVVNIESTMQAIQRSLEEAELMADCKIKEVYTGIAGSHIRSINSTGMVKIRDLEVDKLHGKNNQSCQNMVEKDASLASTVFETLFISKSIERVADHAVNVSKEAVFMATSRDVRHAPEYKKSELRKEIS